jgi:O-antigen ligase
VQVFLLTKFPLKSRYWLKTLKIAVVCFALWLFACLLGFSNTVWLHFPVLDNFKIYIAHIAVLLTAVLLQIVLNILVTVAGNSKWKKDRKCSKCQTQEYLKDCDSSFTGSLPHRLSLFRNETNRIFSLGVLANNGSLV